MQQVFKQQGLLRPGLKLHFPSTSGSTCRRAEELKVLQSNKKSRKLIRRIVSTVQTKQFSFQELFKMALVKEHLVQQT